MEASDVRRRWADRSGEFSPAYYAYRGPDERSEVVRALLKRSVGREGRVLEVGCSAGRHLAHLHDAGFERLHGVDVNAEALSVLREHYPGLADRGTFHVDSIGAVAGRFGDDAFDAVYSVETLQHVHPDEEGAFDAIARIAGERIVTVENEHGVDADTATGDVTFVDDGVPLWHRDWNRVFTSRGFEEVESTEGDRTVTRVFRPTDD